MIFVLRGVDLVHSSMDQISVSGVKLDSFPPVDGGLVELSQLALGESQRWDRLVKSLHFLPLYRKGLKSVHSSTPADGDLIHVLQVRDRALQVVHAIVRTTHTFDDDEENQ